MIDRQGVRDDGFVGVEARRERRAEGTVVDVDEQVPAASVQFGEQLLPFGGEAVSGRRWFPQALNVCAIQKLLELPVPDALRLEAIQEPFLVEPGEIREGCEQERKDAGHQSRRVQPARNLDFKARSHHFEQPALQNHD